MKSTLSNLEKAKIKLSSGKPQFHFDDLPDNRHNDMTWPEIMKLYDLTLSELSALKNARSSSK